MWRKCLGDSAVQAPTWAHTGNARVQILNEVGSPLHIIKNFDWHKDTVRMVLI